MSIFETAPDFHQRENPLVRLSITRLDLSDIGRPGELLLDVHEPQGTAVFRAVSWADQSGATTACRPRWSASSTLTRRRPVLRS